MTWKIKNVPNHQPDLVSSKVEPNLNAGSSYTIAAIVKDTIQNRFSNPMIDKWSSQEVANMGETWHGFTGSGSLW